MKNCLLSGLTKWIIRGSSSCCLAILVACTPAKVQLNVVPLPNDMEIKTGFFEVDSAQFANESMDKFIAGLILLSIVIWEKKDIICRFHPGQFD